MKTPNYPLYKDARDKAPHEYPPSGNTGLWFTRFFNQYDEYKDDKVKSKSQKLEWLQDIAKNAIGDGKKIKDLNDRQRELCKSLGGTFIEVETQSNFVTGMGLSHPVENGFTFHPTLGVPYLSASSVKGLLRGWVEAWMEHSTEPEKNTLIARWFGAAKGNKEGMDESAGEIIFFDALPSEPVELACDVMTPHMGDWYEKGDENNPPADWYSPVPVPFLVVQPKTKFHFMIAPRQGLTSVDVSKTMQELKNALEWIGAGAKTASGYGRMANQDELEAKREREEKEKREIQRIKEELELEERLKAVGMAKQEEVWKNAEWMWDKGRAKLTVSSNGKKAIVENNKDKEILHNLPEDMQKKLEKGKPVKAHAKVNLQGNKITLIELSTTQT